MSGDENWKAASDPAPEKGQGGMTGVEDRIAEVQAMEAKVKRGGKLGRDDALKMLGAMRDALCAALDRDARQNAGVAGTVICRERGKA